MFRTRDYSKHGFPGRVVVEGIDGSGKARNSTAGRVDQTAGFGLWLEK
jgi:hypothetical protein